MGIHGGARRRSAARGGARQRAKRLRRAACGGVRGDACDGACSGVRGGACGGACGSMRGGLGADDFTLYNTPPTRAPLSQRRDPHSTISCSAGVAPEIPFPHLRCSVPMARSAPTSSKMLVYTAAAPAGPRMTSTLFCVATTGSAALLIAGCAAPRPQPLRRYPIHVAPSANGPLLLRKQ